MIILPTEIADLERYLDLVRVRDHDDSELNPPSPVFFSDRPHLLMPLGFDEFRAIELEKVISKRDGCP